jgi:hypothetical protein
MYKSACGDIHRGVAGRYEQYKKFVMRYQFEHNRFPSMTVAAIALSISTEWVIVFEEKLVADTLYRGGRNITATKMFETGGKGR